MSKRSVNKYGLYEVFKEDGQVKKIKSEVLFDSPELAYEFIRQRVLSQGIITTMRFVFNQRKDCWVVKAGALGGTFFEIRLEE